MVNTNIIDRNININLNQSYNSSSLNNAKYSLNDLGSVYTHYDYTLGINVPTYNNFREVINNNGNENS